MELLYVTLALSFLGTILFLAFLISVIAVESEDQEVKKQAVDRLGDFTSALSELASLLGSLFSRLK